MRNSWTAVDQIDADSAVRAARHITVKTNTSHSIISQSRIARTG
jgi:hypothetical protein